MKKLLFLFTITFFSSLFAAGNSQHKTIIVGSFLEKKDAISYKESFETWGMQNRRISQLTNANNIFYVTRKSGPYIVVALEPIGSTRIASELFELIKPTYHDSFTSRVRSKRLLSAYARGEIPDQELTSEEITASLKPKTTPAEVSLQKEEQEREVQHERVAKIEAQKPEVVIEVEEGNPYLILYLFIGLLSLSGIVIYLLISQRKSVKHVKNIEDEIVTLHTSNEVLNTVNTDYKESISEQEGLIEEMSGKLKHPAKEILGKAHKIMDTELSDKQSIELRNIQDSGQVLFAIVDDLLDFMKIRSNKLEIKIKPFNINELLDIIVRSVLERIEKKDVEVVFDIDKNVPPRIIGDAIRIGQVLTNLLENGIKFTNSGEVKLRVKTLRKDEKELQLMFEVIDTGVGIPEVKLDDIFTPFYQIKNTNSAGLGLSISKALVEMMGGDILVSTEVNKGSTFTFVLTLNEVNAEEKRYYRLPDNVYKKRRILIVDYHDNAAVAMKKLLEYFNNEVEIYSQAELESLAPDLSSFDMLFISEKLLTFDLIKQIDPLKIANKIKVVAVASMLHQTNNSNIVNKLADTRIMKPINQQTVFDLLIDFYGNESIPLIADIDVKEVGSSSMPRIVIERTQKLNIIKDDFIVFSGARILVAEDNIINQKVVSSLLKESGIEIDMAENGLIAISMAESIEYDLILMDANMPVMNGYESTKRLKTSVKTAHIPVVALSGSTMPDELIAMKEAGMDDRLEKPIRIPELFSVFSKYLHVHPLADESVEDSIPEQLYVCEDGVERCGGDVDLYKEIVDEFIKLYKNSDELLLKFYNNKESTSMKEMSLDIKGVSANIGAYGLAVAAKKINQSSISSTSMPKFVENYRKTLRKTLDALTSQRKRS